MTPKEGQLCLFQTRALPGAAARKAKPQSWVFIPFSTFILWDFDPVPGLCVPSTSPAVGAGTWQRGRHGTRSPPRVTQLGKGCQEHAAARWVLVPASPQTSDPGGDVRGFLFPVFPSQRCGSHPDLGAAPALREVPASPISAGSCGRCWWCWWLWVVWSCCLQTLELCRRHPTNRRAPVSLCFVPSFSRTHLNQLCPSRAGTHRGARGACSSRQLGDPIPSWRSGPLNLGFSGRSEARPANGAGRCQNPGHNLVPFPAAWRETQARSKARGCKPWHCPCRDGGAGPTKGVSCPKSCP